MEHGTSVKDSPAKEARDHTLLKFGDLEATPAWRRHDKGLNYEAICPNDKSKTIVVSRGFGSFDWATDPLNLKCPCCDRTVDPLSVRRIAVNNCDWQWEGIALDGSKLGDKASTPDGIYWLFDDMKNPWRRLIIQISDPTGEFQPPKDEIVRATFEAAPIDPATFTCPLCKQNFPIHQAHILVDRKLCTDCGQIARARLFEREKARLDEENERKRKERSEKVEKVQLIGLGDVSQVVLKKAPPREKDVDQ